MNNVSSKFLVSAAFAASMALSACGDNEDKPKSGPWYVPEEGTPERIAYDLDLTRYLNTAKPVQVSEYRGSDVYEFSPDDGPLCLRGATYRTSIREAEGSNDLLIFLQGGGACWSDFCLAVKQAPPGVPATAQLLNPTLESNPVKDFNVLYLPYCDGSLFIGDNDLDDNGDGKPDRFHRGLQNSSAAFSVGKERFPNPDRIVLAGSSGGGYGTIMTAFLVRYVWPDTPIFVINDSGTGIGKDGDPAFIDKLISEFGAEGFRPKDCPECFSDGHIIRLTSYLLGKDANMRVAVYTSWYDSVLGDTFLQIGRGAFADAIEKKTNEIHDQFPEQYRRFIIDDHAHTAVLGDVSGIVGTDIVNGVELPPNMLQLLGDLRIGTLQESIGDLTLGTWLKSFVDGDMDAWVDILEERTPLESDEDPDNEEPEAP